MIARLRAWWRWRQEVKSARGDADVAWRRYLSAVTAGADTVYAIREWERLERYVEYLRDAGPTS